jgi:hypothetical protein
MKKQQRMVQVTLVLVLAAGVPAFSLNMGDLQGAAEDFSNAMAKSLAFNSSLGLNWSDAYIGQLIGLPPHFGVGLAGGLTSLDTSAVSGLLGAFKMDFPLPFMAVPGYTVEGRIGGFILPFDVGVKFGILPLEMSDTKFDYLLVGADVRYAVLKGNVVLPKVSVGVGFNYMKGGVSTKISGVGPEFTVPKGETLKLDDPTVGLEWETKSLDFTAQVSKSFLVVTPYLGIGASYAWSRAGYTVSSQLTYGGDPVDAGKIETIKENLETAGIKVPDNFTDTGFESIYDVSHFSLRAFGGLSFNITVIRIDLTGMFNFFDQNWGVSTGVRFQL